MSRPQPSSLATSGTESSIRVSRDRGLGGGVQGVHGGSWSAGEGDGHDVDGRLGGRSGDGVSGAAHGPRRLMEAKPGADRCIDQRSEVGGARFRGAARRPEQGVVAVAFGLSGDVLSEPPGGVGAGDSARGAGPSEPGLGSGAGPRLPS